MDGAATAGENGGPPSRVLAAWGLSPQVSAELLGPEYLGLVAEVAQCLAYPPKHKPPKPRPRYPNQEPTTAGGALVKEASLRLVPEEKDCLAHLRQAQGLSMPEYAGKYDLPDDLKLCIWYLMKKGWRVGKWRYKQCDLLASVANRSRDLDARLKAWAVGPSHVEMISRRVHVGLLLILVEATGWPDTGLPMAFLRGCPVTGVAANRGVFRPIYNDDPEPIFLARAKTIAEGNLAWAQDVEHKTRAMHARAISEGGQPLADLRMASTLTDKEVEKGTMLPGMTFKELQAKYGSEDGSLHARPIRRFAVHQGYKTVFEDGVAVRVPKYRAIDDAKRSRTNERWRPCETIAPPPATLPGLVALAVAQAAVEQGAPIPEMIHGVDDLAAAYRRVPVADMADTVIALWSFSHNGVRFFECPSHPFGLVASVTNFCAVPSFTCFFARAFFLACVEAYVDDFDTVDLVFPHPRRKRRTCGGDAQFYVGRLHRLLGLDFEELKHQEGCTFNDFLGVSCDLGFVNDLESPRVVFSPTERRIDNTLELLTLFETRQRLLPREAESMFGKLQFMFYALARNVGRSALQPLLFRAREIDGAGSAWTTALQEMTLFLRALLHNYPPFVIRLRPRSDQPLILYTDASSSSARSGLGFVFIDYRSISLISDALIPASILELFLRSGNTSIINLCELLAIISAFLTLGNRLRNARIIVFIDNTSALSWCIHGVSRHPEAARLTHALHLYIASLGCEVFWEYVPSAANPADLPSRAADGFSARDMNIIDGLHAHPIAMRLPTLAQIEDLASFLS